MKYSTRKNTDNNMDDFLNFMCIYKRVTEIYKRVPTNDST